MFIKQRKILYTYLSLSCTYIYIHTSSFIHTTHMLQSAPKPAKSCHAVRFLNYTYIDKEIKKNIYIYIHHEDAVRECDDDMV